MMRPSSHEENCMRDVEGSVSRREVLKGATSFAGAAAVSSLGWASPGLAWSADAARSTLATTQAGKVRGVVHEGIHVFKGVRYGADTGPRRFMPPLAPTSWKKALDATG